MSSSRNVWKAEHARERVRDDSFISSVIIINNMTHERCSFAYLYCHECSVMANESEPSINSSFMARTKRKRRWVGGLRRGPPSWRGGADEDIIFLNFELQVESSSSDEQ